MLKLSISLVVYNSDLLLFEKTLQSLKQAIFRAQERKLLEKNKLTVVDNFVGNNQQDIAKILAGVWSRNDYEIITPPRNLGYGLGHNLAIESDCGDYHLVINPDVFVHEDAIIKAICYLQNNPEVGLLTPQSCQPNGATEYLCKSYPSVLVLLVRGFAPTSIKNYFSEKISRYELRSLDKARNDILITSGCFMFFRRAALQSIKGFSSKFFMYFEDFDLSLRLRKRWQIAYVPEVKIVHYGGNTAKKGFKHIFLFMSSAVNFFNRHGWRIW